VNPQSAIRDPQLEFSLSRAEVCDPNVQFFIEHLRRNPTWHTSKQIFQTLHWDERTVRAYAEASDGFIISGQKGYKHIDHATPEEIHHTTAWMESQAKKMAQRAQSIRRRAHQLVG
jgi:hypothetical protein